jgi:hypothetical protein
LYNEVPHGIAIIQYKDPKFKYNSFRGAGIFIHGQLHNAPFTFLNGNGYGKSFSMMKNGRPADGCYYTIFYPNGDKQDEDSLDSLDSLDSETDVSG